MNLPLILTLTRLIISPLLLPVLLSYTLPFDLMQLNLFAAFIFLLLGFTDFLDGYFARKYNQETKLGSLLDPIADKFLFLSALIVLVYYQKIYFYWAFIFIAREFFIMGLREIASSYNFKLEVSQSAKLKTFTQFIYLAFIIVNFDLYFIKLILLILSLYFSVYSAFNYSMVFIKQLKEHNEI